MEMEPGMYKDTKELGMENRMKKLSVMLTILMGFTSCAIADTVKDHKKSCIEGNAKGCYKLGWAYYEGNAVEIDYITAKEYLEIACDYEVGSGCSKLGEMYTEGKGVKKNDSKAREYYGKAKEYYRKACDLNDASGCFNLGVMYEDGREGIERNYSKAREYYKKACDLNDNMGCFNLGLMYESGKGVKHDYIKAREYFKDLDAGLYLTLGSIYESGGDGIEKNDTKAREYYKKACDLDESLCIFLTGYREDKQNNSTDSGSLIVESNKIKEYVLGVIKHGSAQFNYPMGTMPKGMAMGADAEKVAEYVSRGMRGEKPAVFFACASCHGDDGRGAGGLSADLLNLKGVVLPEQRMDAQSIER